MRSWSAATAGPGPELPPLPSWHGPTRRRRTRPRPRRGPSPLPRPVTGDLVNRPAALLAAACAAWLVTGPVPLPTAAAATDTPAVRVDTRPARLEAVLGNTVSVRSTITNGGATATAPLIAHLDVVSLSPDVYVDPEDWSSERSARGRTAAARRVHRPVLAHPHRRLRQLRRPHRGANGRQHRPGAVEPEPSGAADRQRPTRAERRRHPARRPRRAAPARHRPAGRPTPQSPADGTDRTIVLTARTGGSHEPPGAGPRGSGRRLAAARRRSAAHRSPVDTARHCPTPHDAHPPAPRPTESLPYQSA